jgi:hypothetical protein
MDSTEYELSTMDIERDDNGHDLLIDAIDAASDQNQTTWITLADGRRIAKIAPVDEIPDDILQTGRDRTTRLTDRKARIIERLTADGAAWRRDVPVLAVIIPAAEYHQPGTCCRQNCPWNGNHETPEERHHD